MNESSILSIAANLGSRLPTTGVRAVIGPDDRQQAKTSDARDLRMIARLDVSFPGFAPGRGTGFLIGSSVILTCAHVLCVHPLVGPPLQASSVNCALGALGLNKYPNGDIASGHIRVAPQYLANRDPRFDFGIVKLPSPLGDQLGNFGVEQFTDAAISAQRFAVSGYPDPEPALPPRPAILPDTLWFAGGPARGAGDFVTYSIDATTGQSGSPLYFPRDNAGITQFIVAGINIAGVATQSNFALRFRNDIVQTVLEWMKES